MISSSPFGFLIGPNGNPVATWHLHFDYRMISSELATCRISKLSLYERNEAHQAIASSSFVELLKGQENGNLVHGSVDHVFDKLLRP
jgi:hypothetical protein